MTRVSTRSASVRQIKQDKTTAARIHEIASLDKAAKLGTVSARFFRTGSEGYYPKSTELTPEQALLEIMAGHEVEGTAVTWRTYRTRGKSGAVTGSRKVRTKVRNSKVMKLKDVQSFEQWWTAIREDTAAEPKPSSEPRTRTRARSSKHW